jgi:flagellar hook-associated protein 1
MPGLSGILEIARRALNSQRAALSTISHNISNANTPGFSRQRINLVPTIAEKMSYGLLGTGVSADRVERIRERFIDQQFRFANSSLGSASSQQEVLNQVEAILNEPSDSGLNAIMSKFFSSFQDLATNPTDSGSRNAVVQAGQLLSQTFQGLSTNLDSLHAGLVDNATLKVNQINQLAQEISSLDTQITTALATGQEPNDLKDQRDLRLDQLSQLTPVTVSEDTSGSIMVSIGGVAIASRAGAVPLQVRQVGNTMQIVNTGDGLPVSVNGGELGGILTNYNQTLPDYQNRLNEIASTLMTRINQIHSAGYGLGTPPPTGYNFFTGTDATNIAVNPAIVSDINTIAASASGTEPGNNSVALALAGVETENLFTGNSSSIMQYYSGLVSKIGSTIVDTTSTITSQNLILDQLDGQRVSVSGVSIDEEMTNMIKYQRAFDAAARTVTTVDQMFQTIIAMVQ